MESWPYPFWFAHRGAGREAPENTLAAFRLGMAAGFRAFECDVQLSRDGQPFLLHVDEEGREVFSKNVRDGRQILALNLVLELFLGGGDDDALAFRQKRGNQVREALADADGSFDEEDAALADDRFDVPRHLELRLADLSDKSERRIRKEIKR